MRLLPPLGREGAARDPLERARMTPLQERIAGPVAAVEACVRWVGRCLEANGAAQVVDLLDCDLRTALREAMGAGDLTAAIDAWLPESPPSVRSAALHWLNHDTAEGPSIALLRALATRRRVVALVRPEQAALLQEAGIDGLIVSPEPVASALPFAAPEACRDSLVLARGVSPETARALVDTSRGVPERTERLLLDLASSGRLLPTALGLQQVGPPPGARRSGVPSPTAVRVLRRVHGSRGDSGGWARRRG